MESTQVCTWEEWFVSSYLVIISIHDLIGFVEEIPEEKSFEGCTHFEGSSFCCGALPLSLDFDGIKIYFEEIL